MNALMMKDVALGEGTPVMGPYDEGEQRGRSHAYCTISLTPT